MKEIYSLHLIRPQTKNNLTFICRVTILLVNGLRKLHKLTCPHLYHPREKNPCLENNGKSSPFSLPFSSKFVCKCFFSKWPAQCIFCHIDNLSTNIYLHKNFNNVDNISALSFSSFRNAQHSLWSQLQYLQH